MHPDLERLIRLQELDNLVEQARRRISDLPGKLQEVESRVAARTQAVADARQRLSENQAARRALEKELAVRQTRLSKFKDQLMEVRTNKEYQAMQKEIAVADREVRSFEDQILDRMLEADDLMMRVGEAEKALAAERTGADRDRAALEQEGLTAEEEITRASETRRRLTAEIDPGALALFEHEARLRKGTAMAEARGGLCTFCHVRLRPQVFNDVRRNDSLIQCESCHRILYFVPAAVNSATQ